MGMYVGEPPYEVSCDECGAAGPARYRDDDAEESAIEEGWLLAYCGEASDPKFETDRCPNCKVKHD
jgi:hypothetical protein